MNDTEKFIDETFRKWKKKLNLKGTILWTSDFKRFCDCDQLDCNFSREQVLGASTNACRLIIFINVRKHSGDKKELENTILHELLHLKFPKDSEEMTRNRANEILVGR